MALPSLTQLPSLHPAASRLFFGENPFLPQAQRLPGSLEPTPDDEDLLNRLASGPLSALGWLGNVLDTPGSIVRGIVAGKNPLPGIFDTSHRTTGRDLLDQWGMIGKEESGVLPFLADLGVSIGLDPLTPLTMGLGPGSRALTAGGKAVEKAGMLSKLAPTVRTGVTDALEIGPRRALMGAKFGDVTANLAPEALGPLQRAAGGADALQALQAANEPLGTLGRWAGMNFGTGKVAESIAGGIDALGEGIRYSAPGRLAASLFSHSNKGLLSKAGQLGAQKATQVSEEAVTAARQRIGTAMQALNDAGLNSPEGARIIRAYRELGQELPPEFAHLQPHLDLIGEELDRLAGPETVAPFAGGSTSYQGAAPKPRTGFAMPGSERGVYADAGLVLNELEDEYAKYLPRQLREGGPPSGAAGGRAWETTDRFQSARRAELKNIPGATNALEDMARDTKLRGMLDKVNPVDLDPTGMSPAKLPTSEPFEKARDYILDTYFGKQAGGKWEGWDYLRKLSAKLEANEKVVATAGKANPKRVEQYMAHGMTRADALEHATNEATTLFEHAQGTIDPLTKELADLEKVGKQGASLTHFMLSLTPEQKAGGLFNHPLQDIATRLETGYKTAARAGAMFDWLAQHATGAGGQGMTPVADILKKAGATFGWKQTGDLASTAAEEGAIARLAKITGRAPADVFNLHVPAEIAEDAGRWIKTFAAPEGANQLLGLYDKFTQFFKSWVTMPFPGFSVRNKLTGIASDIVAGVKAGDIPFNHAQAFKMLAGEGALEGAEKLPMFKGLNYTAEQATEALRRKAWENGVLSGWNQTHDAGKLLEPASAAALFPGQVPQTWTGAVKAGKPTIGGGLLQSTGSVLNAPMRTGAAVSGMVEDSNRLATWLGLLKDGWDEGAAAAKSKVVHGDYAALSSFEKSVMKRVIPFYTFQRKVLPEFIRDVMEHPGGFTGKVVRAENELRSNNDEFTPAHVAQGLAFPLGPEENGMRKYLSETGLSPIENLNDIFRPGHGVLDTARRTGLSLLGQTNPLIKGPLEMATGKQFYSDRDLKDLVPRTGSILSDQLLLNSPAARVISTVSRAADPRKNLLEKAVNTLTGARTSDVDVNRYRDLAAKEAIGDTLTAEGAGRSYENFYVPKDQIPLLSPDQQRMYSLLSGVEKRARERAKVKAAQLAPAP